MITVSPEIINTTQTKLSGNDAEFFGRVWSQDLTVYENRLRAIDFEGKDRVLDAGFGMGQWLTVLSRLNREVYGIEFSTERCNAVKSILEALEVDNCHIEQGSIEALPYKDNFFDAIYCYSVVLCTDYRKSLREFHRVLKPGGKLYFNTNGLGWYLYNLIDQHNSSAVFSSRQMAIDAIENTITYFSTGKHAQGKSIIMPRAQTIRELQEMGFEILHTDGDGRINIRNIPGVRSFYEPEKYNHESVYEILCQKS